MARLWSRTPGRQRAANLHASLAAASLPTVLQRTEVGRGHCTHWRGPLVDSHFSRASMLGTCRRTRARSAQPLCQEQPKTKGPFKQLLRAQKYPEVDAGFWQTHAWTEELDCSTAAPTTLLRWYEQCRCPLRNHCPAPGAQNARTGFSIARRKHPWKEVFAIL